MDLKNLGKFRVNGSIDTQWQTTLAVERVLIASGQKVSGITTFLTTLEMIGAILTIFLAVFIIATLLVIHILLFLVRLYKYFFYTPKKVQESEKSSVAETPTMVEVSEEDEEILENFH